MVVLLRKEFGRRRLSGDGSRCDIVRDAGPALA
jgi:hypothetical protein